MSGTSSRKRGGIVGRFAALPHAYFLTPEFAALSGRAVKLLVELELQHDGKNNGDLHITRTAMRGRGFTSTDQLTKARDELVSTGWVLVTRQGGRHTPSLYALSYRGVDRCEGKLDVAAGPALHLWRTDQAQWREARKDGKSLARRAVQIAPHGGTPLARTAVQR